MNHEIIVSSETSCLHLSEEDMQPGYVCHFQIPCYVLTQGVSSALGGPLKISGSKQTKKIRETNEKTHTALSIQVVVPVATHTSAGS